MSDYIHPSLKKALKWDEEGWKTGDENIIFYTQSGSTYKVTSAGKVSGGRHEISNGRLVGAIYRRGGPIRINQILEGMGVEICWNDKVLSTTTITKIEKDES